MSHGERRKALVVGINAYEKYPLYGCENDAKEMTRLLSKHEKNDPNFECLAYFCDKEKVTGKLLKSQIKELLKEEVDISLLYFSGHGTPKNNGLCLVAQDYPQEEAYIELSWILEQIQSSPAEEVFLILDCCFSGGAGNLDEFEVPTALLRKGVTILAAASATDTAEERSGHGKFTRLLCRGLEGAAIDMVGHVTSASLYAYADSFLSLWEQKPVYKAHISGLTALRYCYPKLAKKNLREVANFFPRVSHIFPLDKSYLPQPENDPVKINQLKILKQLRRHGFIEGTHSRILIWEAQNNGGCRLTPAGRDLHLLVNKNKI